MEANRWVEEVTALVDGLDAVDWEQVRLMARLSPGQRIRSAMQAHAFAVASLRATFRRRFPELSPAEVNMKALAYLTPVRMPKPEEAAQTPEEAAQTPEEAARTPEEAL